MFEQKSEVFFCLPNMRLLLASNYKYLICFLPAFIWTCHLVSGVTLDWKTG